MKRLKILCRGFIALLLAAASPVPAFAAANTDPDWPCIQRKVPQLSIAQVWTGPDLPENAAKWADDPAISHLATEMAARRNTVEDAQKLLATYIQSIPRHEINDKLMQLFQGIFEKLNWERQQIISGISRYAAKQRDMAADLRREAQKVDAMRAKPDADQAELTKHNDRLTWETRIFEERTQSLTYICEVPTILEQRLYKLANTISQSIIKE
ncbi:hypothetical protein DUT91_09305 [Phyllobacterium salinisoli]|uniref:Uncharacterized protein n=1 Tax=Phyllobacterium salinisoli TaxID=1899321 RepID=A0A368K5I6_9HYPH|nr:hypothetical protein [Phyllobacterium salinisoli]RCS24454.1 hypothetical protein DUT91_09305 [Phyllobacterium salinisoli]